MPAVTLRLMRGGPPDGGGSRDRHDLDAQRSELQVRMQAHLERGAALEPDAVLAGSTRSPSGMSTAARLVADDRAKKAVPLARPRSPA